MTLVATREFPERFAELKKQLVREISPNGSERLITAWKEILGELEKTTQAIQERGSDVSFTRSEITSFSLLFIINALTFLPCTLVHSSSRFLRVEHLES